MKKCPRPPLSEIDESIRKHMKLLNDCGFCTTDSCSGLEEEHKYKDTLNIPYFCIDVESPSKNKIFELAKVLSTQELDVMTVKNGKICFYNQEIEDEILKRGQNVYNADEDLYDLSSSISERILDGLYPKLLRLCMSK